jgi:hypothetical protein
MSAGVRRGLVAHGGATNLGDIGLRCSDLLSHSGDVIKAGAVCFEPDLCRCRREVAAVRS